MHDKRDDPAFPATYSSHRPGITLRQLAALILRVTDSGTAWMDEMIAKASDQQPATSPKVAKQEWHDQQELKAVRELNRELAIPGMIGSPAWYDAMRKAFNPPPLPDEVRQMVNALHSGWYGRGADARIMCEQAADMLERLARDVAEFRDHWNRGEWPVTFLNEELTKLRAELADMTAERDELLASI